MYYLTFTFFLLTSDGIQSEQIASYLPIQNRMECELLAKGMHELWRTEGITIEGKTYKEARNTGFITDCRDEMHQIPEHEVEETTT